MGKDQTFNAVFNSDSPYYRIASINSATTLNLITPPP